MSQRKIEFHDLNQNYYYGTVNDDGNIDVYEQNNPTHHLYGKLTGNTFELHDMEQNYYYGTVRGGNVELHDREQNYFYGTLRD